MTYNNRCPQCGGEGHYMGRQEVPPSKFGGRRYVSLYECGECETSFMEPGASEVVKKAYNGFLSRQKGVTMYYEEKIIEGQLFWRGTPDGFWKLVPYETVLERLVEAEKKLADRRDAD